MHSHVTDTTFDPLSVCKALLSTAVYDKIAVTGYGRRLFAQHWPDTEMIADDILFVGGGALNRALHPILEQTLARRIIVPPEPQILAALGAAIHTTRVGQAK